MAVNINKVLIQGRLGRNPEVKYMQNGGDAVCNLSVATSTRWKDKNSGEQREETEWHRVTLYRRQAEIAGEYLRKGSEVYIEGRLKTRSWEQDGVTRYATEIIADQMQLGAKPSEGGSQGGGQRQAPAQRPAPSQADMDDQDVPF